MGETLKVLMVEDNPGDARLVRDMLDAIAPSGSPDLTFELEWANCLSTGLKRLDEGGVDVVLLDLLLPDSQGLGTLVKTQTQAPHVPVIVLTGLADEHLAVEAARKGAQDYLVKGEADGHLLARFIRYAIERKHAEGTLRRQAAELQARNKELDAFAHTVAHDLKAPLSLITGFADLVIAAYDTMSEQELVEYLQTIQQSGRRMSDIVEGLLLLARVAKAEVPIEPLDMASIVDSARQRLAHVIAEHQAQIVLTNSWPTALGYAPWVEEVWANYLSNALKYGGRPPYVQVGGTAQADGLVRFWVRDNGAGISPEKQAKLFAPSAQIESICDGQGFGLSIVQHIVAKLGGQVGVESKIGRGSVFSFSLPATTG
jgi:signal transduction histidine kinase